MPGHCWEPGCRLVSEQGGTVDLWEPLFVATNLYDLPKCRPQRWRCLSVPAQVNATVKTVIERKRPLLRCLSLFIGIKHRGRLTSLGFFGLPEGANGEMPNRDVNSWKKKDTATWQNFVGNMKIPSENVAQSLLSLFVRYVTLDIYIVTDSVGYLLINKIEILVG